ncbi:MAG: hypothetical protein Q8O92_14390 [Candidatus Latescibacter sp.]|nr:hypothetical protein [Candidatus Latescibacter sp.]
MPKRWTHDEEDFLLDHFESMSREELADRFEVTVKSVSDKVRRLQRSKGGKGEEPGAKEDPLKKYGSVGRTFVVENIKHIDYHDIADLIGVPAEELREAVENSGIKLPIEKARPWNEIPVGSYKTLKDCARCQVQSRHSTFVVGFRDCHICCEENIKHWIEMNEIIRLTFTTNE